jgi:CHAT domain-containing protein
VQLYCEIQESIIKPEALDVEDTNHARLLIESYRTIANEKLNSFPPEKLKPIISSLNIRYEAAQYFLELRKFAKVDALSYKWSELAFQFMINAPAPLNLLEAWIMDTKELAEPLSPNLSKYLDNDQFVRFLRLRPLFRDIYNYEVKGYFAASNAVAKSEPVQSVISDINIVNGDKFQYKSFTTFENKSEYKDFYIKIKPHLAQYEVTLESGSDNFTDHAIEIPFQEFEKFNSVSPTSFSMRNATFVFNDQAELLKAQGTLLYNTIFASDSLKSFFISALKEEVKRRIVIEFDSQLLSKLPWESLYIPELEIFPALYTRFSIVRNFPNPSPINRRTLTPPLRILVVTASPKDLSLLALEDEILTMEKTLADAIRNGQAKLEIIRHATIDAIQQSLRRFQPHLFHFAGHAVASQESQDGLLILENSDGSMRKLEASLLKSLLVDSNISLAVLNSCDTGTNNTVNAVTSLAGELVKGGITAAIATTEVLLDSAALMFSREFYRAFVDGYTLEESITEARKAICMERLNWASYTLFSGTTNLDLFKLTLSRTSKDN